MTHASEPTIRVNNLTVYPQAGEIRNAHGDIARLGPVNMRILEFLISRGGHVVLRTELFDEVWPNQVISDDALTRCISDIRLALSKLSENHKFIETIPKRGYRWNLEATTDDRVIQSQPPLSGRKQTDVAEDTRSPKHATGLTKWLQKGLIYASILLATGSLSVWIVDLLSPPALAIVVVMPTQSDPDNREIAVRIEEQISEYLIELDQVDLLSKSAVQSRPNNPFPYFYHEFGARWLIESELQKNGAHYNVNVALVDARAGVVIFQRVSKFEKDEITFKIDVERIFEPLSRLVSSP